jgi:hypothetical protein
MDLLEIRRLILNKFKSSAWRFIFCVCRFMLWLLGCLCVFMLLLARCVSGLTCFLRALWSGLVVTVLIYKASFSSHGTVYCAFQLRVCCKRHIFSCMWIAIEIFPVTCGLHLIFLSIAWALQPRFFQLRICTKNFDIHVGCNWDFFCCACVVTKNFHLHLGCTWVFSSYL